MIDFLNHNLAPLMFVGLILFMLYGYPAAFSLAAVGLFFGLIGIKLGLIRPDFLGNIIFQLESVLGNDLLLAIPFFTLMGAILERCGLAEDLLEGFGQLFGGVRGGLSYAVILVGAVLGAITGTVAASVIAMALISLPIMIKYGYNIRDATGVIAASGTITQLIPPSLVLVVLADQLGKPVGQMYMGAMGASVIQVLLFMAWVFILSILRPGDIPALPPEARTLKVGGQPDIFPECGSRGAIGLGDQVALPVKDVMHRPRRYAGRRRRPCHHLLQRVVGVGRSLRCRAGADHGDRAVPDIVGGGEGIATLDIHRNVARRIMGEAAGDRAVGGDVG